MKKIDLVTALKVFEVAFSSIDKDVNLVERLRTDRDYAMGGDGSYGYLLAEEIFNV